MERPAVGHGKLVVGAIIGMALLGVLFVLLDWRQFGSVVEKANWLLLMPALLSVAVSYLTLSYGFTAVCRLFGIQIEQRTLALIGFVSFTLNHLVSTGGVAGFSLRVLLMRRRNLAAHEILAPSLFHSYISNLAMMALFPIGLLYLLVQHELSRGQVAGIAVGVAVLVVLFILGGMLVFIGPARGRLLRLLAGLWRLVTRRDIRESMMDFDTALAKGVRAFHRRPLVMVLLVALVVIDWASTIAALWFCFEALGSPVGLGVLLTGFIVGVVVGLLSIVPGGIGIQEGSMSGVYALLGVPFEQALLATVLYRVVYYIIPFLLSLLLYRHLLAKARATV